MNIFHKILSKINQFLYYRHINPLSTLWINLCWFPLKTALKLPVIIYGRINYSGTGKFMIMGNASHGMIKINKMLPWAPANDTGRTSIINAGTVVFNGKLTICTGVKIAIHNNATLSLGNDLIIADDAIIGCMNSISIGSHTRLAHRSQIMDSSYHFTIDLNNRAIRNNKYSISIGDFSWIANTASVCGEVHLPKGTIVSAYSLVNKTPRDIVPFTLIGGIPAKILYSGIRRIYNPNTELELINFFSNPTNNIYKIDESLDITSDKLI